MFRTRPGARPRALLLVILLAGMALRCWRLGSGSLWYDETVSVYLAGSPVAELLRHTAGDIHPPGYYLLLRAWLILAGYPTGHADAHGQGLEFASAFLSLCFGVALIALAYALARRLVGRRIALLAAALVAFSPYNVWYGQEVRMYTLGAACGLVVLLALWQATQPGPRAGEWRRWLVYALAAAAGMYTLYYFAFLLVAVNLWAIARLVVAARGRPAAEQAEPGEFAGSGARGGSAAGSAHLVGFSPFPPAGLAWPRISGPGRLLLANLAALALYAPWLGVAWRQATQPPVPPWRTAAAVGPALYESWTALVAGQSAPAWLWPAALALIPLYLAGLHVLAQGSDRDRDPGRAIFRLAASPATLLVLATFGALALVLLASAATPLYHVRYVFTYGPAFYVVLAAGLAWLWQHARAAAALAASAWLVAAGITLHGFWYDPRFQPDDHRSAVAYLESQWRPGDAVIVNAGYAYTALATYWQGPPPSAPAAAGDAIAWRGRLTGPLPEPRADDGLVVLITGHVDGGPGLGWADPRSDFFAMSAGAARGQIAGVFRRFNRVWHYRIYDTVNDPQGVIRQALEQDGTPVADRVFAGEAFMRVQGYVPRQGTAPPAAATPRAASGPIQVAAPQSSWQAASNSVIYPRVFWHAAADLSRVLGTSLRLADAAGRVWSQPPDEQPLGPLYRSDLWRPGWQAQTFALPVPEGTPPGRYAVYLLVYDTGSGGLLGPWGGLSSPPAFASGHALALGAVEVRRPAPEPPPRPARGRFGPLALLAAATPATQLSPGDSLPVELLWQAAAPPGEPLVVVLQLLDGRGRVAAGLEAQPVDGSYPTQLWETNEIVRDPHILTLPKNLAQGSYRLIAGVYRAGNGRRLETAAGPLGQSDHVEIKTIAVR